MWLFALSIATAASPQSAATRNRSQKSRGRDMEIKNCAYNQGWSAFAYANTLGSNPYPSSSKGFAAWENGWLDHLEAHKNAANSRDALHPFDDCPIAYARASLLEVIREYQMLQCAPCVVPFNRALALLRASIVLEIDELGGMAGAW